MGRHYSQLSMSERKRLQQSLNNDMSLRAVARGLWVGVFLPSAIECRSGGSRQDYDAVESGAWARSHRRRGPRKLLAASPLAELVERQIIRHAWSPEQIAGRLRMEPPGKPQPAGFSRDHLPVHLCASDGGSQEAAGGILSGRCHARRPRRERACCPLGVPPSKPCTVGGR